MTLEMIEKIISAGEGIKTEFKEARSKLPNNLFESVCAFLNRIGGDLLLGVQDSGNVVGILPDHIDQIKSDIVNLSHNPNKLDPPFMLFPEIIEVQEKVSSM